MYRRDEQDIRTRREVKPTVETKPDNSYKISQLRSQIAALENQKALYVKLKSDINSVVPEIEALAKNIWSTGVFLGRALTIDNATVGEANMTTESNTIKGYASTLSGCVGAINTRIRTIQEQINTKNSELNRLV